MNQNQEISNSKQRKNHILKRLIDKHFSLWGYLKNKNLDLTITDIGVIEKNVQTGFIDTLFKIPYLNMFVILYQFVFKNVFTSKSADNVYYTFRGMFCWTSFSPRFIINCSTINSIHCWSTINCSTTDTTKSNQIK